MTTETNLKTLDIFRCLFTTSSGKLFLVNVQIYVYNCVFQEKEKTTFTKLFTFSKRKYIILFSLSNRNDSDSDCDELSDGEISKLLIVTQTPNRPRKHEGFDRTGDFCSRVKLSQDLAQVINDGLSYYEVILILVNINTTF